MNGNLLALISLIPGLFAFANSPSMAAHPTMVDQASFTVVGIEVRTNNSLEATGQGKIAQQWQRFFKEEIAEKIFSKIGKEIVVVYSNYQSDKSGEYEYLIGMKVSDASQTPQGMVAKTISNGKYARFTTATGPVSQVVPNAWKSIWAAEDEGKLGGARSYKSDFEIYDERSRDPKSSQVDIYVGVK